MNDVASLHPVAVRIREIMSMAPEQPALLFDDVWFTWRQLTELADTLDQQLSEQHIDLRSPVALVARNRPSGVAALLGLLIKGRRPVLISPIQPPKAIELFTSAPCPILIPWSRFHIGSVRWATRLPPALRIIRTGRFLLSSATAADYIRGSPTTRWPSNSWVRRPNRGMA